MSSNPRDRRVRLLDLNIPTPREAGTKTGAKWESVDSFKEANPLLIRAAGLLKIGVPTGIRTPVLTVKG